MTLDLAPGGEIRRHCDAAFVVQLTNEECGSYADKDDHDEASL
jgi:hypothetical protein